MSSELPVLKLELESDLNRIIKQARQASRIQKKAASFNQEQKPTEANKFNGVVDLIEANKVIRNNSKVITNQELVKILKEPEPLTGEQVVKLKKKESSKLSNNDPSRKIPRSQSNQVNKLVRENSQIVKHTEIPIVLPVIQNPSEDKKPKKVPIKKIEQNEPTLNITSDTPRDDLSITKLKLYPSLQHKIKKYFIIFSLFVVILVILAIVISVVLSVVISSSCLVKNCDTTQKVDASTKVFPIVETQSSSTLASIISRQTQTLPTTIIDKTTTKQNLIKTNCNYGYSGSNCQDECGLKYNEPNVKIVGGVIANKNSWPSAALIIFSYKTVVNINSYLYQFSRSYICGGTLIDRRTILTAAHCIIQEVEYMVGSHIQTVQVVPNQYHPTFESMYKVYLGVQDKLDLNKEPTVEYQVSKIIKHENYQDDIKLNDIALLKLEKEVVLNEFIQISCLPNPKSVENSLKTNISAWSVGWGSTYFGGPSVDSMYNVKLTIYDGTLCNNVITSFPKDWNLQICAGEIRGGKDTCQGDSGGSLYIQDYVNGRLKYISVGIVSYGDNCGLPNKPGIYTRISPYLDWINEHSLD